MLKMPDVWTVLDVKFHCDVSHGGNGLLVIRRSHDAFCLIGDALPILGSPTNYIVMIY